MAVLGLRYCARAFSSCGKWGPLFIAVHGPLIIAASLVAEHRLQMRRLSNRGSRAQLLHGMWDLPRSGLKPVSPALAGGFLTTVPPGKPYIFDIILFQSYHLQILSSIDCLFCFVDGFFCCAKAFMFNQVPFIFAFVSFAVGDRSKKILLQFMSMSVLPMFSSRSFIVFGLTFRSLIHFIFVYGVRECSYFIILHVAVQFSQHHLLKRLSFLHCMFLPPLSQIN